MNDAERIWRDKSDDELIEAAAELTQFTEEGQRIIRAELKRRGLEDPVDQAGGEAAADEPTGVAAEIEAEEPECLRCQVPLRFVDPEDPRAAARWGWLGGIHTPLLGRGGLDVFVCPRCGHVEFFTDLPETE